MTEHIILLQIILVKQDEMYHKNKHCDVGKNSKAAKRLYQFPEHKFKLKILRRVRNKVTKRKIHQAYYLMCIRPFLNNHLESVSFILF